MNITPKLGATLVLALLCGLSACKKPEDKVGPAQQAGAAIDDAGAKVAAKLHEPIDKAREVGKTLKDAAKDTGDKIQEATDDASKGIDKATVEVGKKVEQAGEKIQEAGKK